MSVNIKGGFFCRGLCKERMKGFHLSTIPGHKCEGIANRGIKEGSNVCFDHQNTQRGRGCGGRRFTYHPNLRSVINELR